MYHRHYANWPAPAPARRSCLDGILRRTVATTTTMSSRISTEMCIVLKHILAYTYYIYYSIYAEAIIANFIKSTYALLRHGFSLNISFSLQLYAVRVFYRTLRGVVDLCKRSSFFDHSGVELVYVVELCVCGFRYVNHSTLRRGECWWWTERENVENAWLCEQFAVGLQLCNYCCCTLYSVDGTVKQDTTIHNKQHSLTIIRPPFADRVQIENLHNAFALLPSL